MSGKRIEVLKDAIPTLSRIAVLFTPRNEMPGLIQETDAAARSLRLEVLRLEVGVDEAGAAPDARGRRRRTAVNLFSSPCGRGADA